MSDRTKLELSQAEVAAELGISRARVQQIERKAIAKLARALGLASPYKTRRLPSGNIRRNLR